jgi:ubiquitin C-terminal hydrolase
MNSEESSSQQKKGVVGLTNLGLTCYANATLQCLRHIERVPWIFTPGRYDTLFHKTATGRRLNQQKVATSFADVVSQQENGTSPGVLRPAGFWNCLHSCVKDTMYEQFATKAPHDSHEFLMFMLETLHESISIEVEMEIMKRNPTTEEEKRVILALDTWKKIFSKEYSPLVDLFYGLLHIQMHCQTCGNISHKWETFNTLKVGVPKTQSEAPPDILELLTKEFEGEVIEGYSCDKCSPTRTTAKRKVSIWRLPQTLILCLKRFNYNGSKIHTSISASAANPLSMLPLFSEESPEKGGTTDYSLRAIVDHHGSASGGHYTAQCKDKIDSQWYVYDDEHTQPIQSPLIGGSTYILFYERTASQKQI